MSSGDKNIFESAYDKTKEMFTGAGEKTDRMAPTKEADLKEGVENMSHYGMKQRVDRENMGEKAPKLTSDDKIVIQECLANMAPKLVSPKSSEELKRNKE